MLGGQLKQALGARRRPSRGSGRGGGRRARRGGEHGGEKVLILGAGPGCCEVHEVKEHVAVVGAVRKRIPGAQRGVGCVGGVLGASKDALRLGVKGGDGGLACSGVGGSAGQIFHVARVHAVHLLGGEAGDAQEGLALPR
jgi:hypothetical protein